MGVGDGNCRRIRGSSAISEIVPRSRWVAHDSRTPQLVALGGVRVFGVTQADVGLPTDLRHRLATGGARDGVIAPSDVQQKLLKIHLPGESGQRWTQGAGLNHHSPLSRPQ